MKDRKILIIIFIIALVLDQVTKVIGYVNGWNININGDNSNNGYYIIMTIIIVIMIIRYISNENTFIKLDTKVILTLAISGAIGNLIDRIWNKNVIIFMDLGKSIYLNFAYIYVLIAWIGLAAILTKNTMKILKEKKERKSEHKSK
ncbi:MAG: signal peptidase II [Clostridia bacterium]|jgi:signal peptidase II